MSLPHEDRSMSQRAESATKRKVKDAPNTKEFNKHCKSLERDKVRIRPEHKHERYDRIADQEEYERGIELAFGKRDVADVRKNAGSYRKVFNI